MAPPPVFPGMQAAMGVSPKSRAVTGVLAFLFNILGIHRFYVGKTGTGALFLIFCIVGIIMLFTPLIVVGAIILWALGLWAFIDFIMILMGKFKDKNGLYIKK